MAGSISRFFQRPQKQNFEAENPNADDERAAKGSIETKSVTPLGNSSNPLTIDDSDDSEDEVVAIAGPVSAHSGDAKEAEGETSHANDLQRSESNKRTPQVAVLTEDHTPEKASESPNHKENPFLKFAFAAGGSSEAVPPTRSALSWRNANTSIEIAHAANIVQPTETTPATKKQKKEKCGFIPMKNISKEEQEKIVIKWLSLVDPSASLETRRFQVLLSALLHARCQEPSVRKAISTLRGTFTELTASIVAQADPEILAQHITNLQYYNTKSQYIVKAAKEIEFNFGGIVPEDELSLLKITGVGKVFADLLSFVNTRENHIIRFGPIGQTIDAAPEGNTTTKA